MAKKSKPASKPEVTVTRHVAASKPKEKKPQVKIPLYEQVIDAYLATTPDDMLPITTLIDTKFKGKDVSTGTIAEARGELFSLMLYVENNDRFNKDLKDLICKVSEGIVVDGGNVKYKEK